MEMIPPKNTTRAPECGAGAGISKKSYLSMAWINYALKIAVDKKPEKVACLTLKDPKKHKNSWCGVAQGNIY